MKHYQTTFTRFLYILVIIIFAAGCRKDDSTSRQLPQNASINGQGHLQQTKTFSSDGVIRWLNIQLDLTRVPLAPGTASQAAERCLAYCGIALYEAVVPGMPAYQSLGLQLYELPKMPTTEPGKAYHWAASANAALAYINRHLFPNTTAANNTAMDDLENSLNTQYATEVDAATLKRSVDFGRAVAKIVFDWSVTDGTATSPPASSYIIPVGDGLWEKTPPNFGGPVAPFPNLRRLLVPGSGAGSTPVPPPPYSTSPSSAFYAMAKDVYDRSFTLTPAQIAAALYHRDAPGYPGGGSLPAMLAQIFKKAECSLDISAIAYVKVGLGSHDGIVLCFREKYKTNLLRPVTYIHKVIKDTTWLPLFNTPGHPEFPSAHSVNGAVLETMLTGIFGNNFSFTLNHYDYLGLQARSYGSFKDLATEMSDSRPWAGIHYQASCDKGLIMGKKISNNILGTVKFLK